MFADVFTSLGAQPIPINTNKLYDGLKTGQVEGQENPLAIVDGFKLYEVQRYCSLTSHMWSGYNLLANLAMWRKLPDDVRGSIERNAIKYVALQRADNTALNDQLQGTLAMRGMIFNTPTPRLPARSPISTAAERPLRNQAWAMLEAIRQARLIAADAASGATVHHVRRHRDHERADQGLDQRRPGRGFRAPAADQRRRAPVHSQARCGHAGRALGRGATVGSLFPPRRHHSRSVPLRRYADRLR